MVKIDFPPFGQTLRVNVTVDGTNVGFIQRHVSGNGWSGRDTHYTFHPNEAGMALGLDAPLKMKQVRRYADARALIRHYLSERLPIQLGI